MLPLPDSSTRYVEEKTGRPTVPFYNWLKQLIAAIGTGTGGGGGGGPVYFPAGDTIYVRSGGNNSNDGLTVGTAVHTLEHATDLALGYVWNQNVFPFIDIGPGTFQGCEAGGYPMGGAGSQTHNVPYLNYSGAGRTSTTITSDGVSTPFANVLVFNITGGMGAIFDHLTIDVPNNMSGIFAQFGSNIVCYTDDLGFNGNGSGSVALHCEDAATIFIQDTGGSLKVTGTFGDFFTNGLLGQGQFSGTINNTGTVGTFAYMDGCSILNCFSSVLWTGNLPGGSVIINSELKGADTFSTSSINQLAAGGFSTPSPAASVTGSTGLGAGSSAAIYAGSTTKNGYIQLNPAGAPGNNGTVTVAFGEAAMEESLSTESGYFLIAQDGTGAWNGRAAFISNVGFGTLTIKWNNNAVNLTAGSTYYINYFSP